MIRSLSLSNFLSLFISLSLCLTYIYSLLSRSYYTSLSLHTLAALSFFRRSRLSLCLFLNSIRKRPRRYGADGGTAAAWGVTAASGGGGR